VHEGSLYVTGRLKDVIIIRGRNHAADDIERTVQACNAALRPGCGAAFGVEVDGDERLVVVQEVGREHTSIDVTSIVGDVREAITAHHALSAYAIALVPPGSVPKTSSGKVQRRACRATFLEGALDRLDQRRG